MTCLLCVLLLTRIANAAAAAAVAITLFVVVSGPNCLDKASVPGQWNGREDAETGDEIERKYSPVTDSLGHFDLMLKVYAAGESERFPDGGKMSQYLKSLKIGDELEVAGPAGHVTYEGTTASGASRFKV